MFLIFLQHHLAYIYPKMTPYRPPFMLGLQGTQSRSYLCTLGPRAAVIYTLTWSPRVRPIAACREEAPMQTSPARPGSPSRALEKFGNSGVIVPSRAIVGLGFRVEQL